MFAERFYARAQGKNGRSDINTSRDVDGRNVPSGGKKHCIEAVTNTFELSELDVTAFEFFVRARARTLKSGELRSRNQKRFRSHAERRGEMHERIIFCDSLINYLIILVICIQMLRTVSCVSH